MHGSTNCLYCIVGVLNSGKFVINNSRVTNSMDCSEIVVCSFTVTFGNNNAINGGGLSCVQSNITLKENTTVSFTNNAARLTGGAISNKQCMLVVKENSSMTFHSNRAREKGGGAINAFHYSYTIFDQNSTVSFTNNTARIGGAMRLFLY